MTGMVLSESTTILSSHHRSARDNSSSSHSVYHYPHSSHPRHRQSSLSSLSILPTHRSTPPSLPHSICPEMPDRPTLPGIASLLALAGQHRSVSLSSSSSSHSHSKRPPQSSDPVAHALPASVDNPPHTKSPPVINHPSPSTSCEPTRHQSRHRLCHSRATITDPEERSPIYPNPAPIHPQHHQHILTSTCSSASLSSDFGASLNIAPQAHISFRGVHPASSSASVNSLLSSGPDRIRQQFLHTEQTWTNEEGSKDHAWNQPSSRLEDQTSCDYDRRRISLESSSHHHIINRAASNHSPSQMSVSPDVVSSSRLAGLSMSNTPSCPQNHRYQCLEVGCGKTFSRPSSLKIHSYSHTGQKPFKCMRCDRAFSVQSNLKRHQKVHEKRSVIAYPLMMPSASGNPMSPMIPYESGSGCLIEEESGEDEGVHDRMTE